MGSLGYQAPFPFAIALDAQTGAGSLLPPGVYLVAWVASSCSWMSSPCTASTISSKDG